MNSIYNLSTVDDIMLKNIVNDKEFLEFSNNIYRLEMLVQSSMFIEAVEDTTISFGNMKKIAKKNTLDTTRDIAGAYDNITDANANVIKASWDIFMRALQLVTRVSSYIVNKISNIPKMILKVSDRAMDIPGEVKAKIRGDITLYITANDIGNIYNKLFIRRLTEYITLTADLAKGDFFATFFNRRRESNEIKSLVFGKNDMKLCRKMDDVYNHLENMEFKPSIISMKDDSIVEVYFGNSKSIDFTDIHGNHHNCSYYDALNILIKDLESKKEELKSFQKAVGEKLHKSETNQTYNDLNNVDKHRLSVTINQISKVVTIIGNFVKYVTTDINTLNNSIDTILHKKSNLPKIDGKKAASTPETKINTKL